MASQPCTETMKLAAALAEFDPQFLGALNRSITSWIAKKAKGAKALEWMVPFCRKGYSEALRELLQMLPAEQIEALSEALDKFNPALNGFSPEGMIDHIVAMASGEIEPAPKPVLPKPAKKQKAARTAAPTLSLREIVRIEDEARRKQALENLSAKELKSQMQELGMDAPAKLNTKQRIQFVLEELAAGWPRPRSVLDRSRY